MVILFQCFLCVNLEFNTFFLLISQGNWLILLLNHFLLLILKFSINKNKKNQ